MSDKRWHRVADPETGYVYESAADAARAIGVSESCMLHRIARGFSPVTVMFSGKLTHTESRDHLGNEFPSISDMARAWGLRPGLVRNRLRKGQTIEEALAPLRRPGRPRKHKEVS